MIFRRVLASLLATLIAAAQQAPPAAKSPQAGGDFVIRTTTNLVIETVGVKDKKGNPIEGLTAKDFIVTEDNQPQTIRMRREQD